MNFHPALSYESSSMPLDCMISISSSRKSVRSNSVSSPVAPMIEAPEMMIVPSKIAACCSLWRLESQEESLGSSRVLGVFSEVFENKTCREPTTRVEETNAEITPIASARPKYLIGSNGENKLAKKAAMVVTTASVSGANK